MNGNGRPHGENRGRNGHVLVWEQPGLEEEESPARMRKTLVGSRHIVTLMLFFGMANAYVMRTNMSVAIVAMVNHTSITESKEPVVNECGHDGNASNDSSTLANHDGEFHWDSTMQGYLLSSFFYGYVITQIPFGILAKRYGSKYFLGIGMLINSMFGLLVPVSARAGYHWLMIVRFIQGLGEGPIVPCTHAMLAKWIPPNERSRMGAFVYAGAQFGTVISMPLSGVLSRHGFDGGWPSIFYVFGAVGTIWCIAFLLMIYEDPESHPRIAEDEKKYILSALWGNAGASSPPVPWFSIVTSLPFWAILIAHMGQNYGYETLMTELPTFMKQILNFDIESNGTVSALPYLAMWIFSMLISHVADWMISSGRFNHTFTRKIVNSIGQFGPAIALAAASYTGCNSWLTVTILTIGVGLNGGIYSGFKVNHLDISPRFAGILMSFTNCLANLAGLLAPITAGYIIVGPPTHAKWRLVFMISAGVYIACATFYVIFGSGQRQPWDNPDKDEERQQHEKQDLRCVKTVSETQH
ncbi:inorganic phosphate cotransporter isoform X1 [Apis mellifera caucasica]|uniref:Putative inorganic phosphate cotransporter n=2 Tax=Apis mellifera TaxID=7460 RepID=A0A7M7IKJ2_APIME|nr:putative inorganic phosphate cotransporter isoform X1 [Apis mellifera]XP_016770196.1 putative inorganic phosphate cotransporter isoform X1 [Apis mellifera]KAG6800033.1 inorganic phosphate cotransporter isoform X1 [Apis mellifera caucasica]KAG9435957.1 inorganic phosphate cotransporter isoform X1 [Apis mellifera carnica]|eukprot:XP_006570493.1 putative inorganic phosphate cotransporter isoform X1 [Apis mellifera]